MNLRVRLTEGVLSAVEAFLTDRGTVGAEGTGLVACRANGAGGQRTSRHEEDVRWEAQRVTLSARSRCGGFPTCGVLHAMDRAMHVCHVIDPDVEGWNDGHRASGSSVDVATVANAVFAGLGTVFTATRSVVITVLAAGLAAFLGLLLVLRHWHPR